MKSLNIRKKLVTLAVASVVSGGAMMTMTAPAHAMNVSQDNVGQVLLFPYYTVRNGFDTVFTVTNTTDKTAIFKIRFREALNSREVRDFNVILSPFDHWSAGVTETADGALVRTFDKTCTSPQLPASASMPGSTEVEFTNALFTAPFADGGDTSMDRVREGYFEVILMGVSDRDPADPLNEIEYNAKHVSGVPRDCAAVDALFISDASIAADIKPYFTGPENILKGHVTYIDVDTGKAIDSEPTAIENWLTGDDVVSTPGDQDPSLASGDLVGQVNSIVNGVPVPVGFTGSANGVSTALRTASLINEFATGTGASTSWVVTFPTKHHYTDAYTPITGPTLPGTASGGFSDWFYPTDGQSCDTIEMGLVNREEGRVETVDNTQFSPFNPSSPSVSLCYEVNVIDFNGTSVFGDATNNGETTRLGISTTGVGSAGWSILTFNEAPAVAAGGLPAIGFSAIMRDGADATVNYGSSTEHTMGRTYP